MTLLAATESGSNILASIGELSDRVSISLSGFDADHKNLARRATSLGATLQGLDISGSLLTAVLGYRSQTAYAGILGCPDSGKPIRSAESGLPYQSNKADAGKLCVRGPYC
jgi:hypothetical protein